ncbi:MAG: hypothetical protein K0R38_7433 [Polyangiaceae bacterium]|jgi:hypothetical protein|nr:hypothetical protein [Polyangiaceae bacterium]
MTSFDAATALATQPHSPSPRVRPAKETHRKIRLPGGRILVATPVFDTYWRFACKRQDTFMRRVNGEAPPWSDDPVISGHRFTNAYRASDRVSQYLIRNVQYAGEQTAGELFFRTILFKLFNRIETWEHLVSSVGEIRAADFSRSRAAMVLDRLMKAGETVYSAAYIMPSPAFGAARKHSNHLKLLDHMMLDGAPQKVAGAPSMEAVFKLLRGYPSLGDFLAFQLTIDLNYSALTNFSEMDFVVAGPGARDGIKKCFAETDGLTEADVIRAVADMAEPECERQGLSFKTLWGRPLQLIDCQNLFCEVDKYARVMHPEASGASGRTRIKQRFVAVKRPMPQWYPPKWNVHPPASSAPATAPEQARSRKLA